MNQQTALQVSFVNGGFILTTEAGYGETRVEVFTSPGKLMKALRTAVDEHSLVAKKAQDDVDDA